jgi:glycosyltransferase involved in cell wall biosynthesis
MITVSQAVAEDYQAQCRVGTDRIRVISNGIDLDRFSTPETPRAETRRALAIPEEAPVLITVASLTEQKVDTFPNLIWVIVGGGKLKDEIEALADRPATRRHCRFLGNRQDVPDLLHASDLFVLPSLWEGFGIAALEAAAAGLPLVLSRTGGMVEVFAGPEEAALFATPGNAGELAQQIRTLLQDPTLHRQLSLQARARAEQYDLNTIAQQWFDLYRSLVDGTGL